MEPSPEPPSERLVAQRVRNRIIDALGLLADGDSGVRSIGPSDYFELFYDWVPHHADGEVRPNGALTADERDGLLAVRTMLDAACDATPRAVTADGLIATGWPARVQPVAGRVLRAMLARGRFREDREEDEPTPAPSNPRPTTGNASVGGR